MKKVEKERWNRGAMKCSLIVSVLTLMLGCARYPAEFVSARVWTASSKLGNRSGGGSPAISNAEPGTFATAPMLREEFPESQLSKVAGRANVGLAFSGGGNRAAVCALGQVRGLQKLGLMNRVRYISCVSGGAWFCVPYTFAQRTPAEFLGPYIPPGDLHWKETLYAIQPGSFAEAATRARMPILNILNIRHLRGDENYAYHLNNIYLKPFGLGNEHQFFCGDQSALASALQQNAGHLTRADFNVAPPGRPYLIANATIVRPWVWEKPVRRFVPVEMTSDYVGAAFWKPGHFPDMAIGGGYVEAFGYDTNYPITSV